MNRFALLSILMALSVAHAGETSITVENRDQLRQALNQAKPGTTIQLRPGTYPGGLLVSGLKGEPDRPIVIEAADPNDPPVIEGGGNCLQLVEPSHVELRNLVLVGASGNGLNIDDGGDYNTPAQHVVLSGLVVRDVGPEGNRDGIKLSGVDDFRLENCVVEDWGRGGSAIDMVGCHRGEIVGCTFRGRGIDDGSGVQAKGGSSDIVIRGCRFEQAGHRALNLGGSTGKAFFRPLDPGYEAKALTVEDCVFVGSMSPVAFVGVDGAIVRHNTFYRPRRWALRILQESQGPEFVPCRNGQFRENIIAFRSDEMVLPINIGPGTDPESFELARNLWYCLDAPSQSQPRLPIPEQDGTYGVDPQFRNAEAGNFELRPDSPAHAFGVRPKR